MILSVTFALVLAAAPLGPSTGPADAGAVYPSEEALERYLGGRLLEEQGQRAEALDQFYRALLLDPKANGAARRISEIKLTRGESESALEFAERALAADPQDARASWLRGAALLNLERPRDAMAPLETAVAGDSEQVPYWRTLAVAADAVDDWKRSEDAWRHAAWLDDDDAESWFQYAASATRLGHFGAADSAARHAEDLNPLRPGLTFLEGWIAENRGDPARAIERYRHQLTAQPDDNVRRRLLGVLVREERWKEALIEARPLSHAHPDDVELKHLYLEVCFRAGERPEAMHGIEEMRRVDPEAPEPLAARIDLLARHGEAAAAAAEAEAWSARHPADLRGDVLAAFARERQGRNDLAEIHLRHALGNAPDSVAVWYTVGRFYQDQQRTAAAESLYARAVTRFPAENGLWFSLAGTRDRLGDQSGAEVAVRDVLRREPDNPTALNFLGYMWADHGQHLDEAEGMVKRAIAAEPDNGAFIDSLGWIYFRLGRFDEARPLLERAVDLTGGDAVVREHLGDVYKALKLNDLARVQYRQALVSDAGNSRLRTKLDGLR